MKKAIKISAVLLALVVLAALTVIFTSGAEATDIDSVDALAQDGNYRLVADITVDKAIKISGNVTLDLNGHTISFPDGYTGDVFTQTGVTLRQTITIKDDNATATGAIVAKGATLLGDVGGSVKVTGGIFDTKELMTAATKAVVNFQGIDDGSNVKGTWTSFDPATAINESNINGALLDHYSSREAAAGAPAKYQVYPRVYNITYEFVISEKAEKNEDGILANPADVLTDLERLPAIGVTNPNVDIKTRTVLSDEIKFNDPTLRGYAFVGWALKYGNEWIAIDSILGQSEYLYDTELVGVFKRQPIEINYNLNGATNSLSNPAQVTIDMDPIRLQAASKAGYKFVEWHLGTQDGDVIATVDPTADYCVYAEDSVLNLYPVFAVETYTITFVDKNGREVQDPQNYTVENDVELGKVEPVGYTFLGWYYDNPDNPDAKELDKEGDKWVIPAGSKTGDLTIYAKYELTEYTIKFDANGGTAIADIVYTIETPTFALPRATGKTGEDFTGWTVTVGNKDNVTADGKVKLGTTGDMTVQAQWTDSIYRVDYVLHEDKAIIPQVNNSQNERNAGTFTYKDTVYLKAPTLANYEFDGWYYKYDANKGEFSDELKYDADKDAWVIPEGTLDNVTVYAKWTPTVFTITYQLPGYTFEVERDANGNVLTVAVQYDKNDKVTNLDSLIIYQQDENGNKIEVPMDDDLKEAIKIAGLTQEFNFFEDVNLYIPTLKGWKFKGWRNVETGYKYDVNKDGKCVLEAGTVNVDITLEPEWEIATYVVELRYVYNYDWQAANKKTYEDSVFRVIELPVVYNNEFVHEVRFLEHNGLVPEAWFYEIEKDDWKVIVDEFEGNNGKIVVDILFEPVVLKTTYENGVMTVEYADGSKFSLTISSVASLALKDNTLVYKVNGEDVAVANVTDVEAVKKAVEALNPAITALQGKVDENSAAVAQLNTILGQVDGIATNADSIKTLNESIAALEARADALEAKDTTYLIIIIILAVVTVATAAGVVVLFVKRSKG